jgi:hypothetical protein
MATYKLVYADVCLSVTDEKAPDRRISDRSDHVNASPSGRAVSGEGLDRLDSEIVDSNPV